MHSLLEFDIREHYHDYQMCLYLSRHCNAHQSLALFRQMKEQHAIIHHPQLLHRNRYPFVSNLSDQMMRQTDSLLLLTCLAYIYKREHVLHQSHFLRYSTHQLRGLFRLQTRQSYLQPCHPLLLRLYHLPDGPIQSDHSHLRIVCLRYIGIREHDL